MPDIARLRLSTRQIKGDGGSVDSESMAQTFG